MAPTRRFQAVAGLVVLGLAAAIAGVIGLGRPRPLGVVQVSPSDRAGDVAPGAQVVVTFSRPVDEASARAGLALAPPTDGFVSVAGRRAAFTPRFGFRGGTAYTLTLAASIRDRSGRELGGAVVSHFRTRPLGLVLRTPEGRLLQAPLGGAAEPLAAGPVGAFAVGPDRRVAYVRPDVRRLALADPARAGTPRELALPPGIEVREMEWAPDGRALLVLAATGEAVGVPYLVRLDAPTPTLEAFGPRPARLDPNVGLIEEALKRSLVEIVYGQESFAFTPDGRAAIVRDVNWDLAVIGLDGERRGRLGPFLAVGNATPRADLLAVVDVNPADPALRRRVLGYRVDGRGTHAISDPERDSHAPRFAHRSDRIVFATAPATGLPRERAFALEVADLATGARRRLTEPPAGESDEAPRWSPDDAWVSFRRGPVGAPERGRIWLVPAEGGAAEPLPIPASDARFRP